MTKRAMTKQESEQLSDTLQLPDRNRRRLSKDLENRAAIVIVSGKEFGSTYVIQRYATLIGRLKKCDITLEDQSISKVHCTIVMDDNGVCSVDDLVSTNPTYLNGKKIRRRKPLSAGDTLIVGKTVMMFLESIESPT